jgi:hypothetical protein
LNYEWTVPKNKISKAEMDANESAIAGIRNSFPRVCMMPVKSMSPRITATEYRAPAKYKLLEVEVVSAKQKVELRIEQTHNAILRALIFSGEKVFMETD